MTVTNWSARVVSMSLNCSVMERWRMSALLTGWNWTGNRTVLSSHVMNVNQTMGLSMNGWAGCCSYGLIHGWVRSPVANWLRAGWAEC